MSNDLLFFHQSNFNMLMTQGRASDAHRCFHFSLHSDACGMSEPG